MPRRFTLRERIADAFRLCLLTASGASVIAGVLVGYRFGGWTGITAGLAGGVVLGIWIRRSIGWRGPEGFHSWYKRIRERANGGRAGILEILIEAIRGHGFSQQKSKKIIDAYDMAMGKVRLANSIAEEQEIVDHLDKQVKRISYME